MTLRIPVPEHFRHAGEVSARYSRFDPRDKNFQEPAVDIDLREALFIRPQAVLWCVIYPLLAQGAASKARLLVPEDKGVCVYLKSLGLFEALQSEGVEVDDRGIPKREDPQVVLPLTPFTTESEADEITNAAFDALGESKLGAGNLYPLVSEVFAELALNAVTHAESKVGAYGFIQFYEFKSGKRFVCGVADGGIGIRASLERNPELRDRISYDWDAIELAVRERVSGTGEPTRGIGLYGVAEDLRKPGSQLIIHSGIGSLMISERVETQAKRTTLFPGTLTYASIPT